MGLTCLLDLRVMDLATILDLSRAKPKALGFGDLRLFKSWRVIV